MCILCTKRTSNVPVIFFTGIVVSFWALGTSTLWQTTTAENFDNEKSTCTSNRVVIFWPGYSLPRGEGGVRFEFVEPYTPPPSPHSRPLPLNRGDNRRLKEIHRIFSISLRRKVAKCSLRKLNQKSVNRSRTNVNPRALLNPSAPYVCWANFISPGG